jgi:hypothetical protein
VHTPRIKNNMCISDIVIVKSIDGETARVSNGRIVRLGPLKGKVGIGDHLEVYADIAMSKVTKKNSREIREARRRIYDA